MDSASQNSNSQVHKRKHHSHHSHHSHSSHSQRMEDIQKAALAQGHASKDSSSKEKLSDQGSPFLFTACFLGIFISYFVYGLLQERITKQKFGERRFNYFSTLVGIQCLINAVFAKTVATVRKTEVSLMPYRLFSMLGFSYVAAMLASNSSLAYISYPTQVLGKSAKPIPVLLFGVLFGHRRYPVIKYLIVLSIVVGVALFLYKDKGGANTGSENGQYKFLDIIGIGEFLIMMSLFFDGVTGALQDRVKAKHDVSAYHMMYAVNVFAAIYLSVVIFLSGEGVEVMGFLQEYPSVLLNIVVFGLASAVGQNFIFLTITNFGPLTCSIFTTTRKFFTILGSVLIFGNVLIFRQWIGVLFVFTGLGLDVVFGRAIKKHHHHHHHEQTHPNSHNHAVDNTVNKPVTTNV